MSHGHFLSPKLFYCYLSYSHVSLFQLSCANLLISLLVLFSAPTPTHPQTSICNYLATIFAKLFSTMAQSSPQIYLLQSSFLFGSDYRLSRVSLLAIYYHVPLSGFQHDRIGWSDNNFILKVNEAKYFSGISAAIPLLSSFFSEASEAFPSL